MKIPTQLIILFFFVYTTSLFAQQANRINGFGGPTVSILTINNQPSFFVGGQGAILFNKTIAVGGFGMVSLSEVNYRDNNDIEINDFKMGLGGFQISYFKELNKKVGFTIPARLYWGELEGLKNNTLELKDSFWGHSLGVGVIYTISDFLKITPTYLYNSTYLTSFSNSQNFSLSRHQLEIILLFGGF